MTNKYMIIRPFLIVTLFVFLTSCKEIAQPTNLNASKEAVELLNYFYDIKVKLILPDYIIKL